MNLKLILKVVGRLLIIESISMLLPLLVAFLYGEPLSPFLIPILLAGLVGVLLSKLETDRRFFAREGFAAVGLIWLVTVVVGALPFALCGYFPSFADCLFESASGFTTTGATILPNIEALPYGILFWRSFTHWLGGMGVLVLASAILPSLGIRSHYLTQAESPGPVFSKLVPKQSQSSKILYGIYCGLSLIQVVCLKLAGMPLYDSFIHAFSSAGTGGFSNRNASVGAYNSLAIELIITLFILIFSVNFAVYFLFLTKKFREILLSDELRFFLLVVALSTALITLDIAPLYGGLGESLRYSVFQVASIISTTGFATADYVLWPHFSQMVLILLMFCGACAGSTGGGIKCSRILILLRVTRREIRKIVHPRSVEVVKLDGKVVEEDTIYSIGVFFWAYMLFLMATALILSLDDHSFAVSFSSALTCLSNIGPGLETVGPSGNFAHFSALSKLVMSMAMIVGRLEIFPILVLFSRSTWKRA